MNAVPPDEPWQDVHRIVFPVAGEEQRLPLYVETPGDPSWSRFEIVLAARTCASFGAYFSAFPAAYWWTATAVRRVRLDLDVSGRAVITVRSADGAGVATEVVSFVAEDSAASAIVELTSATGTLWFEVVTDGVPVTLRNARWSAPGACTPGRAIVGITTHNRTDDCLRTLRELGEDPGLVDIVDRVLVIDQGSRTVRDAEGYRQAIKSSLVPIEVIEQPNLGGSGGFSRSMLEASRSAGAAYVLLLDDDVRVEPESVRRLVDFADRTTNPTIVGAQMLSAVAVTQLHSFGEQVRLADFSWSPVVPALSSRDLVADPPTLAETSSFRRVDFNGWWMCLIPLTTVRAIGLSLPYFIKWDDTEFSLRAAAAGTETVTLPGAAIWHMPWTAKDDGWDWQAYFQLRNRIVTALVHSPRGGGGLVLPVTFLQDVNHLVGMQYGSTALRVQALRDVLSGPDHLWRTVREGPAGALSTLEAQGQMATPLRASAASSPVAYARPRNPLEFALRALRVAANQIAGGGSGAAAPPVLPRAEAKWWSLGLLDAVDVRSAEGSQIFVLRRDRRRALRLAGESFALRARLWLRWRRVAASYRRALRELVSAQGWERVFDQV